MKANDIQWKKQSFHPVIKLPEEYEIYDFSGQYDANRKLTHTYGIGKFNEVRPDMYKGELYEDQRNIHMGIDIGAPIGTPVHSFYQGKYFLFANNDRPFDYGHTIITEHEIEGQKVYALYGHLSRKSTEGIEEGQSIEAGEVIGFVGDKSENGGWNPHLHFQLSLKKPSCADMPGVVSQRDLQSSLEIFIDPRLVLGPLY